MVTGGNPRITLEKQLFFHYYKKVRAFKYTRFSRFASKEGITDHELLDIVDQLEADQADANLGGDVYKVRVARQGEGKSGGHRVIVFFRNEFRTFFTYGFAKSDRGNISKKELKAFKAYAKKQFLLTDEQIEVRLRNGTLIEITEGIKMKYESDILETIHENASIDFKLGFITEAEMREFDKLCLAPETSQDNNAKGNIAHETVNIEHANLVTA